MASSLEMYSKFGLENWIAWTNNQNWLENDQWLAVILSNGASIELQ